MSRSVPTTLHALHERADELRDRPALWTSRHGVYLPTSWREYAARVKQFALGLDALGFSPGDVLGIVSTNREEWVVGYLAALALGGVPVGVAPTEAPAQVEAVLRDAHARAVIAEGAWASRVEAMRERLPRLQHVIALSEDGGTPFEQVLASGQGRDESVYVERVAQLAPESLAVLAYTAGTTGAPRAVKLSHRNLAWTTEALARCAQLGEAESTVSYLPLAHVAEQVDAIHGAIRSGVQVFFAEPGPGLLDAIRRARPTVLTGSPRIWEQLWAGIEERIAGLPPPRREVVQWARRIASMVHTRRLTGERVPASLEVQLELAQRLALGELKGELGFGRGRLFVSQGASIDPGVLDLLASVDLVVRARYGQTEATGAISANAIGATRLGTAGQPLPGLELRISEEGEVWVRGPGVCLGYLDDPAATRTVLAEGWLKTGDLGELDGEGYLTVTGRLGGLVVTSEGGRIDPAPIEARLRRIPPVGEAWVYGEGRPYLVAVLTLDLARAERFARQKGLPTEARPLAQDPAFRAYLQERIDREVNAHLGSHEAIRRFAVLPEGFSQEGGELTATLELRRTACAEKHRAVLEPLYAG